MKLGAIVVASAIALSGVLGSALPAFGQTSSVTDPNLLGMLFRHIIFVPEGGAPYMYLALAGLVCAGGVVLALRRPAANRSAN
ncbi:MAG: hypothetical protein ACRD3N_12970 [Terracidiphilus sp.]